MKSRLAVIFGSLVFGPVIIGGTIAIFGCFSLLWWTINTGIIGLILDLVGAILIVIMEIAWFDRFWRNEDQFQDAQELNEARNRLYNQGPITSGELDFDRLIEVIEEHKQIPLTPYQLKPPKAGGRGGSNHVRIFESNGGSNPDRIHIHDNLFNNWIDNRIEELRSGERDSIRFIGLLSLLVGFGLQSVSYLLRNYQGFRELIHLLPNC